MYLGLAACVLVVAVVGHVLGELLCQRRRRLPGVFCERGFERAVLCTEPVVEAEPSTQA